MLATEHHLFVLRDGVLYQFDVHSLQLLRSHRFDGERNTAKVAATAAATDALALPEAPTRAQMQASVDSALTWLADKGYDPAYGARPLKRVIQKELVDVLARKLLAGEIEDGSVVSVSVGVDGLEVGKARVH